jgi:hypothetical protein
VEAQDENAEVLTQLCYVDWVLDNVVSGKKRWGRFEQPTTEVECDECNTCFWLEYRPATSSRDWEVDCPSCDELLELQD